MNRSAITRAPRAIGMVAVAFATAPAAAHAESPSTALPPVRAALEPSIALAVEAALLAIATFAVLARDRRAARRPRNAAAPLTVTRRSGGQVVVRPPQDPGPLVDAPPAPVHRPPVARAPAPAPRRAPATPSRHAVPSRPAPAESESEQCRIEWSPASGGARFRAVGTNRAGRRYVAGRSAIVVADDEQSPTRTADALAAHEALVKRLAKQGWHPTPSAAADGDPWYALTLQRHRPGTRSSGQAPRRSAAGSKAP